MWMLVVNNCSLFPLRLPQTGQPMEQLSLVPNLNLRRLIKDLLAEGGEGLYLHRADSDSDGDEPDSRKLAREQGEAEGRRRERGREENRDYRFALVAEQILVLKVRPPICMMAMYSAVLYNAVPCHLLRIHCDWDVLAGFHEFWKAEACRTCRNEGWRPGALASWRAGGSCPVFPEGP